MKRLIDPSGRRGASAGDIADRITTAIVERRLPPGTRLPETRLAEVFGVSRTVVREALQRLVHGHLCVQEPNRSARIAAPTISEVRNLYEVRRLLECSMINEASTPLTRTRLGTLKKTVALEADANAKGNTRLAMQLADTFHLELATAIGNPIVVDILGELIARANVALALYEQPGRASCRCDEHRRILEYLSGGGRDEAASEMRAHLSNIEESLVASRDVDRAVDLADVFASARSVGR